LHRDSRHELAVVQFLVVAVMLRAKQRKIMHTWLKSIGSARQPITDHYTDLSVGFRKKSKPGIRKGDHLFFYAPGGSKRIFALAEATDNPERDIKYDPEIQGSCRWKLSVRYLINLPVADGVHLDDVRSKRHLAGSIRQQSHINLRPEESQSARKLLESRSAYRKNTKNMSGTPPAIRVFPMGRGDSEVDSYPDARALQQGFFLEKLPNRKPPGTFLYKTRGLRAVPRTLVLFQFESEIIASAIFVKSVRQPIKKGRVLYKGALYFDVNSIRVFKPVPWDTVRSIWKNATPPSHVKQKLAPAKYFEFSKKLEEVSALDGGRVAQIIEACASPANDTRKVEEIVVQTVEKEQTKGQGFILDKKLRLALEDYAMNAAKTHFKSLGFVCEDRSKKYPYDLHCRRGKEVLYVEVKGTQTKGEQIILTNGEVKFAHNHKGQMALFVLHSIKASEVTGKWHLVGGERRLILSWAVDYEWLTPLSFMCRIPIA
jgi:hypothetical protein